MDKERILTNDWKDVIGEELTKPYYLKLREFLKKEYATGTVFPEMHDIFNALHHTPYQNVKVVILGQDPYFNAGQAHGLSFSVKPGVAVPPSLRNMYKELQEDIGCRIPDHGHLTKWAEEGVLLLNAVLTVRGGEANSHQGKGWETFTNKVIEAVNDKEDPVVFLLWGASAKKKLTMINTTKHLVLTSPHPSPLSAYRGFFGSQPFSQANAFLEEAGRGAVDWCLPDL